MKKYLIILLFIPFILRGQDYLRPIGYFKHKQDQRVKRIEALKVIGSSVIINAVGGYLMVKNHDEKFVCFTFTFSLIATIKWQYN